MTRYFKVLPGTREWELFNKLWTHQDKWLELTPKMNNLFGCEVDKNLAVNIRELYMSNPPQHLKEQFSKRPDKDGFYRAKSNSKISKQWMTFVKAYGLDDYNANRLIWELNIRSVHANAIGTLYPMMEGYYYFQLREDREWGEYDWAIEVDEPAFLRIRANWLEDRDKHSA